MFPLKNIMTKNVISVVKTTPIYEAMQIMTDHKISGLPVVDGDSKLVGVLSEWDVLQLLIDKELQRETTVESYMTREVVSFQQEASAMDVCEFFKDSHKRRVPVLNGDRLVGIVSRHDLIKLILQLRKKISGKAQENSS